MEIYDSLEQRKRPFVPVKPGIVSIYVCGATVQSVPHIGHLRSGIAFDIVRRWFMALGNDVLFIRNVTDIDDKILQKAAQADRPWWEWAYTHELEFDHAYRMLNVLPPSASPHATGFIPQMLAYIQRLIDRGHAYAAGGDVYFSVRSYDRYGQLSGQKIDDMQQGEADASQKRFPQDFTLWKGAKPGEPSWESPWGPGRPGWHTECNAMSTELLGESFDIHGGGMDLQFPHHENERAQAHCAGHGYAQYWMHNGWITMGGEKMSKSLGNVVSIPEMLKLVRPIELRYYLGLAHYRSVQDYSEAALREAAHAYGRIEAFVTKVADRTGRVDVGVWPDAFAAAMNDDFGVPAALALVHDCVREGNQALAAGDLGRAGVVASQVRAMLAVLGVDPLASEWSVQAGVSDDAHQDALGRVVQGLLSLRDQARGAKDFVRADQIRDQLASAGITIEDTARGSTWSLRTSGDVVPS